MRLKLLLHASLASLVILVLLVPVSSAGKPGPGTTTGSGRVFLPNPVATLQDQSLTDQKDADYPALQPAYRVVTLTNLDGSGYLRGDWANVLSQTGDPAYSSDNTFVYNRHDDRFEQVMAYYWVTEAQKYIQSLGFGTTSGRSTRNRRISASTSSASTTPIPGTNMTVTLWQRRRGRCRGR